MPDARTIWLFGEHLVQAGAVERLFARFDRDLANAGYLAMGGQIIDGEAASAPLVRAQGRTIVSAPKQRNTDGEKADIRCGRIPESVEGQAGQAAPERPRRAPEGEVSQGEASRTGQVEAGRHRGTGVRLQESHIERSPPWVDP